MCGILLVKSLDSIPLEKHLSAFALLNNRGPDFSRYRYNNNIFIGQTVLHITGTTDYYDHDHDNFLAYNGEIYNYRELGNYSNDIEFVHHCVETDPVRISAGWGPWAWAWSDNNKILYATDPQGERCLYQYQDEQILIVCSEVKPILEYIQGQHRPQLYHSRHWAMLDQTPWTGISRIQAGVMYENGQPTIELDSVWSWIKPDKSITFNTAVEQFRSTWQSTCQLMTPDCPAALTYSGGLDSSIILSHIDRLELYTTNMTGKDPIADQIHDFLTAQEQTRLHQLHCTPEQWAQAFRSVIDHTQMPIQSWSFPGQWLISQACEQRVLFTGVGADELFGGYSVYQNLTFTSADKSTSPYSLDGTGLLWHQCLSAYDDHVGSATLLMDYFYQVAGCDVRGVDLIAGAHGIETRNPFLARPVMQFALNLPFELRVSVTPKPMINRLFLDRWRPDQVLPKKGFTGHCNDSLPWLGVDITLTGNRDLDWREIVFKSFYKDPS